MSAAVKNIISRLAKMKALAVEGVGGEREVASRLIEKVAAKYGIDLAALDGMDEVESSHPLDIPRGWKLDLFRQLMALMRLEKYGSVKVLDHCYVRPVFRIRKKRSPLAIGIRCCRGFIPIRACAGWAMTITW